MTNKIQIITLTEKQIEIYKEFKEYNNPYHLIRLVTYIDLLQEELMQCMPDEMFTNLKELLDDYKMAIEHHKRKLFNEKI